jgi:EAL domain-containing protein (putative c-di-GMP-specific phosphodiesterase class I)
MTGYRPLASLGIAAYPEHGVTSDELMRSADMAMYSAKAKRTAVAAFRVEMRHEATQVLEMRNALNGALGRGEFLQVYQPIMRLSDGEMVGAEALLRWRSPGRGLLAPGEFLHLAEMAGLLHQIDRWVLQRAAADVAGWRAEGLFAQDWWVSVNQTAEDLVRPDWGNSITEAARLAGAGVLQIELTEGHMSGSLEALQRGLRALEGLGVKLAVDDFGTGYSNLSYLCSLPITTVKIDRSFVQGIETQPQAQTLVRAMIGLSRQFGYSVVAEGIETAGQLAFLQEEGCDMAQGYLLARPLDSTCFQQFLQDRLKNSKLVQTAS